jgi:hypothetical protein
VVGRFGRVSKSGTDATDQNACSHEQGEHNPFELHHNLLFVRVACEHIRALHMGREVLPSCCISATPRP